METGTQIILQRMIDCPEEFRGTMISKWDRILRDAKDFLPIEDVQAIDARLRQIQIDLFNERVLQTLAGEQPKEEETIKYEAKERYATGFSDPRAFANAPVKAEGQMVDYDHATDSFKYRQMVEEREAQIQRDMRAKVWGGSI
jgi:hypothetical protein